MARGGQARSATGSADPGYPPTAATSACIERGFIRAEVVAYDDFMALPQRTMAKAREAGKLRLEGKDYIVRDGDIINFRFNV